MTCKTFIASIESFAEMLSFVREQSENVGLNPDLTTQVELALEETVVNIISYGFPEGHPGSITICCGLVSPKGIEITIKDNGRAYNPLLNSTITPKEDVFSEGSNLGGLGIYLITQLMDKCEYEYKEGYNHLRLVKLF